MTRADRAAAEQRAATAAEATPPTPVGAGLRCRLAAGCRPCRPPGAVPPGHRPGHRPPKPPRARRASHPPNPPPALATVGPAVTIEPVCAVVTVSSVHAAGASRACASARPRSRRREAHVPAAEQQEQPPPTTPSDHDDPLEPRQPVGRLAEQHERPGDRAEHDDRGDDAGPASSARATQSTDAPIATSAGDAPERARPCSTRGRCRP